MDATYWKSCRLYRVPVSQVEKVGADPNQWEYIAPQKKGVKPSRRRDIATWLVDTYGASVRQACQCVLVSRSSYYYRSHGRDDSAERARIRETAETRVSYGMWRIHTLMRREGWLINHKKTHRIYCEEGLDLRRKRPRRRVAAAHRVERPDIDSPDQVWSMDFVADELLNGQ